MTDMDLINWTIQEAQQLKSARRKPGDPDAGPPLNQLLAVLEREPLGPGAAEEPVAQTIASNGIQTDADDASSGETIAATEANASDLPALAETAPSPIMEARVEGPAGAEEPKSALLMAITEPNIYTARVDRERAIALRWALRDIKGKRLNWSPLSQHDLQTLIDLGLVEVQRDEPVLTSAGLSAAV
jgi:hypothetical protein